MMAAPPPTLWRWMYVQHPRSSEGGRSPCLLSSPESWSKNHPMWWGLETSSVLCSGTSGWALKGDRERDTAIGVGLFQSANENRSEFSQGKSAERGSTLCRLNRRWEEKMGL